MSTPNQQFQLSAATSGGTVVGVEDLRQSLHLVLLTERGSVPTKPEFGCGLIGLIDLPTSQVAARLHQEVVQQVKIWVPMLEITGFSVKQTEPGKISITVNWRPLGLDEDQTDTITI